MEITRELIEQRKAEYEQMKARLISDLDATVGAIQDCEYWLGELDKEADAKPEIKVSK